MNYIYKHLWLMLIILILVIILANFSISGGFRNKKYETTTFLLDTIININAFGKNSKDSVEESIEQIKEIQDLMNIYNKNSELSKLNNFGHKQPVKVSSKLYFVIKQAVEYAQISGGAFDPTIKPLTDLWGIGSNVERVPEHNDILSIVKNVDYTKIELLGNNYIKLKDKSTSIDLGGIAKGYAADQVIYTLKKHDIKSAYANLGGNVVVLGKKEAGLFKSDKPWRIGIQDPKEPRGQYVAIIKTSNKAIVTSGAYERQFESNGKIYHHIIDPVTGYPANSNLLSSTIVSSYSLEADALSTAVYVLGSKKGIELINSIEGTEALLITKDNKILITNGLKDNIEIVNNNYTLID